MQVCTKCGTLKLLTEFHKDKSTRNGFRKWCKKCAVPASIAYHNRNKEHVNRRNNTYKIAHPERYLVWVARYRAKKKNMEFSITEHDIVIPNECPILGIPMFVGKRNNPNSPSIDRLDNSKGYVVGNVCVISSRANALKSDATIAELQRLAKWTVSQYGN
jgi:hypothetical protein